MNLSRGEYHKLVPRTCRENVSFREFVIKKAQGDKKVQAALLEACRDDLLFWINLFVWQYNPNSIGDGSPEIGPFLTWDFQEEALLSRDEDEPGLIWAIENRRDILIEKSRELGASWLCLLILVWLYLFHPWKKLLMISRNQDAVDRPGDADSLFWKVDFVIRYLPDWMTTGHVRRKMGMTHKNGSSITGQASTGEAGVGGRAFVMFIDEFSAIKDDQEVRQRTSDTTTCRIFNGTHRGLNTAFYEMSRQPEVKKLVMHWSQHPDKRKGLYRYVEGENRVEVIDKVFEFPEHFKFVMNPEPLGGPYPGLRSPWYDDQCNRKGSAMGIAMDLDINPQGSVAQVFNAQKIHYLMETYATGAVWIGEVVYDRDLGRPDKKHPLVENVEGVLRLWLMPRGGGMPQGRYCIGGDISTGSGMTPSILAIGNADTGEKVGELATNLIEPKELACLAVALCYIFKDEHGEPAFLGWETPGPGVSFGKTVRDLGYSNVYVRESDVGNRKQTAMLPGWHNNPQSKRTLIEEYAANLYLGRFLNRSRLAYAETLEYKYNDAGVPTHARQTSRGWRNDPSGARDNHGDRVIADAILNRLMTKIGKSAEVVVEEKSPIGSFGWRREWHKERNRPAAIWT